MNAKRILLAGMVLVLTGACAWAATEASGNAGFAVIPDNEAAQILGGLGWACNTKQWDSAFYGCGDTGDCSYWILFYETWQCGPADSGECDDSGLVTGMSWGACTWYPEYQLCWYDGPGYDVPVNGCMP
jgi:hypothetical protein